MKELRLGIDMDTGMWTIWKKPKNYNDGLAWEIMAKFTEEEMENILKAIIIIKQIFNEKEI